jgi:hypothetical protein
VKRALRTVILLAALAAAPFLRAGEKGGVGEYDVKAAFLLNFIRYIEWTGVKTPTPTGPLVIGILGKNPFGNKLAEIAKATRIHGREVRVVELQSTEDLRGAEVVFLSGRDQDTIQSEAETLIGRGLLTVGDDPLSADWGTVLSFVPEGSKIRFAVNLSAARRQGVKISSKLLQLAVEILK